MDQIKATVSKPSPLPLQFDEFCDILGGQSWLQFIYNLKNNKQQNRVKSVSTLKQALTGKHRFLCSGDLLDRQPLEIFYIKLSTIVRTTLVMKDAHQLLKSPLLNICSHSIRIGVHSTQSLAPSLWNYRLVYDRSEISDYPIVVDPNVSDSDKAKSPQHDFYCLGMLIARALLVNHTQNMTSVKTKLDQLANSITDIYTVNKLGLDQNNLQRKLLQIVDSFLDDPIFQQCNVVYKPRYYNQEIIKPPLWRGILNITFRLITRIPGFSFYSAESKNSADIWDISQDILDQLSDAEHQAKRVLLTEPLNPSGDLQQIVADLTSDDNWTDNYFDADNTLISNADIANTEVNKHNGKNEMIEIDIFSLEEDLSNGKTRNIKSYKKQRLPDNDNSIPLEYFDSMIED